METKQSEASLIALKIERLSRKPGKIKLNVAKKPITKCLRIWRSIISLTSRSATIYSCYSNEDISLRSFDWHTQSIFGIKTRNRKSP